jgi:hypothetical protein
MLQQFLRTKQKLLFRLRRVLDLVDFRKNVIDCSDMGDESDIVETNGSIIVAV